MVSGELAGITEADMAAIYASLLERFAPQLGRIVTLAAEPDRLPLVFHCAAGKDRTGLAAVALLGALGVGDADLLADYELTNAYRSARRIEQMRPELAARGVDIEVMQAYFSRSRAAMADALALIEADHGSLAGYLTGPGGVAESAIVALRDHLLEAA